MALTTALVIGAAVSAAGTVASYNQQRKAAKSQAKSQAAQQRQADIANARERRAAVRNARVARASIESQGALTGTTGSSGVAGAVANVQGQLAENLSFLDQNAALANEASVANQQAADYMSRAGGWGAVAEMGSSISGFGSSIFSSTSGAQAQGAEIAKSNPSTKNFNKG